MKQFILLVATFIFFGIGTFLGYQRYQFFSQNKATTEGKVIQNVEKKRKKGYKTKISYSPIFQFSTPEGQTYTIASDLATNPAQYEVGEQVKLYYNPAKPDEARPYSWIDSWLIPLVFIGFGILLFVIYKSKR
jgi:hypothetical protein